MRGDPASAFLGIQNLKQNDSHLDYYLAVTNDLCRNPVITAASRVKLNEAAVFLAELKMAIAQIYLTNLNKLFIGKLIGGENSLFSAVVAIPTAASCKVSGTVCGMYGNRRRSNCSSQSGYIASSLTCEFCKARKEDESSCFKQLKN